MKDYPDEWITILNNAFFHKKPDISFQYLDFKRKAGNVLYVLSSNKLQISQIWMDFFRMKTPTSRVHTMSQLKFGKFFIFLFLQIMLGLSKKYSVFIISLSK